MIAPLILGVFAVAVVWLLWVSLRVPSHDHPDDEGMDPMRFERETIDQYERKGGQK